jgi:hypothetical protein
MIAARIARRSYRITVRTATQAVTYIAIGDRDALMDAAYDDGALTLTIIEVRP